MQIELKKIKIKDLYDGYIDKQDEGVVGYGGRLNIRPSYQREFVYQDKQRDEVVKTVKKGFPLNSIYWVKSGVDKNDNDTYELMDGQQRTISICSYIHGDYSINFQYFHNLTKKEQEDILNYDLMVYFCEGNDKEKLDWFKTINIAGEKLTSQELRNAIYTGPWLSDAKRYFSKNQCVAYNMASDYLRGKPIRQEYLETIIAWIADKENISIEEYMAKHQFDTNANPLWLYFNQVIAWVKATFPTYRKEMKGIEWGLLYNRYGDKNLDPSTLEDEIGKLMADDEVTKKNGIYTYVLDRDERHLSLRAFDDKQKRIAYEKQKGLCPKCKQHFELQEMEGDHIVPWSKGGKTTLDNLQMLCKKCNGMKSNN